MHLLWLSLITALALMIVGAQNKHHDSPTTDTPGEVQAINNHLDNSLRFRPHRGPSGEQKKLSAAEPLSVFSSKNRCVLSTTKKGLLQADCSNLEISDIGRLKIDHPGRINVLKLNGNQIQSIPVGTWTSFRNLTELDLGENLLSRLAEHMFVGLGNLTCLKLDGNNLTMTKQNIPESVFDPLLSLRDLYINNNTDPSFFSHSFPDGPADLTYPDWALQRLKSLEKLYIDGLPNRTFGRGFKKMKPLRFLSMNGNRGFCNIGWLNGTLFENVTQLSSLTMIRCNIHFKKIQLNVLKPLKDLVELNVSHNININLDGLFSLLSSQANSKKLTHLNVNMVVNPYSVSRCVSNMVAKVLPRSLQRLDAESNNLEIVSDRVFDLLPKNLSYLNLNYNRFFFGSYLQNISKMTSLKTLTLNGFSKGYSLPKYFPPLDQRPIFSCQISTKVHKETDVFELPPNLEHVEMNEADLSLIITNFSFLPNNSLKSLYTRGNNIPSLVSSVVGLLKLETLDLSNNNIRFISPDFFVPSKIKNLHLNRNDCGSYFKNPDSKLRFPSSLRNLDLSNINIEYFAVNFSKLKNLETLKLKNSHLKLFQSDMSMAKNLTYLDLSKNSIYTIWPNITQAFSTFKNLTIDLSGNTIGCYCDNLDFIEWLVHYPHLTDKNLSRMACDYSGTVTQEPDFLLKYEILRKKCASNLLLLSICTSVCVSLILLNFVFIAYRYRWKLRFWYYSAYLYLNTNSQERNCMGFGADVNIAYCSDDADFAEETLTVALDKQRLRLRISGRDSNVGTWMFMDIVEAVQTCRRTLVVLSPEMLACKWSQATVNFAAQEAVSSKRSVLMFLVVRPVEVAQLSTSLLYFIQNSPISFYPPEESRRDEKAMDLFWKKLASDLK
ncbi:Toll-like receptor e [Elysia marginata]|uniref:Toll-like receptor e n=1 Tax=Elysia marginata TaxID=1093978 RepID=A0AAV4JZG9_9GAST|nr:Toll-like receptor e [Elysia marginata]